MEKAEDLLKKTTSSIKEIASMCGFPSSDSFIKVFRKEAGMTPGNFRGINHIIPLESDPDWSARRKGYP
jgi:AraC-like DNA-binding protein